MGEERAVTQFIFSESAGPPQGEMTVSRKLKDGTFWLDQLQPLVDAFAHRFNHYRPHDALDGKTPTEYLSSLSQATSPSHMS
jgi:transposase InsO family protein